MERRDIKDIDWQRQGAFTFFGFVYLVRPPLPQTSPAVCDLCFSKLARVIHLRVASVVLGYLRGAHCARADAPE